jgi:acetyl esterase/lipase
MSTTMTAAPLLEPAAQAFAEATATPPFLLDANELRDAGVPVTAVRYQGIIHDFAMLNALRGTQPPTRRSARRSRSSAKRSPLAEKGHHHGILGRVRDHGAGGHARV